MRWGSASSGWLSAATWGVAVLGAIAITAAGCSSDADSTSAVGQAPASAVSETVVTIDADVPADDPPAPNQDTNDDDETAEAASEFIDLPYWEGFLADGFTMSVETDEECTRPEPDVTVCEFDMAGSMVASLIGHASETQSGTITTYASETCGGPGGSDAVRRVQDGAGTITSEWGDALDFRVRQGCGLVNWVADGGTGRFEGASGLMSGVILPGIPGFVAVNAGTLTVKAELWEDLLPTGD